MAGTVTIQALANLGQFGLRYMEVGEVDADLAAGPIGAGLAAIVSEPSSRKRSAPPEEPTLIPDEIPTED